MATSTKRWRHPSHPHFLMPADPAVVHARHGGKWFCDVHQAEGYSGSSPEGQMWRCASGCDFDACSACLQSAARSCAHHTHRLLEADPGAVHSGIHAGRWFCDVHQVSGYSGASPAGPMWRCFAGCDFDACQLCMASGEQPAPQAPPAQPTPEANLMHERLSDVPGDDGILNPVRGVRAAPLLTLMDAAAATGLSVDAEAYLASENGRRLAATDAHGLSADEAGALTLYTMDSELFRTLNRLLRGHERAALRPHLSYLRLMLQAREKLPPFAGTVWRGVKGVDLRGNFPEGKELYWWPFSSTTKRLSTLQSDEFLGATGVRTVFNIQVRTGVDIVRYSIYQQTASEAEVLLYPGVKLKVVDSMDMGGGLFMVHLQEMDVPVQLVQ